MGAAQRSTAEMRLSGAAIPNAASNLNCIARHFDFLHLFASM
jgi:hypothetical protein